MTTFWERAAHLVKHMFVLCLFVILVISRFGWRGSDCISFSHVKRKATDDPTSQQSEIIRNELHKFEDQQMDSGVGHSIARSFYRLPVKVIKNRAIETCK